MLPTPWLLADGTDVEGTCKGVILAAIRRGRVPRDFQQAEFDDALRHLLGEAHIEMTKFDPTIGAERYGLNVRLGAYLYDRLGYRLEDYFRQWYGRAGQKRVAEFDPADAGDPRRDRLDEAPLGDPADSTDARGWLHPEGDRGGTGVEGDDGGGPRLRLAAGDRGATSRRAASPPAWIDCECGWRSYRQAPNGRPGWHFDTACGGCGEPFDVPVAPEALLVPKEWAA